VNWRHALRGVGRFIVLLVAPAISAPISGGLFGAAALTTSNTSTYGEHATYRGQARSLRLAP